MSHTETPSLPPAVERFIKQLVVTHKAASLYPTSSNIPRENARESVKLLNELFETQADFRLTITKEHLFYEGVPAFPDQPAYAGFAKDLYHRGLAEIRFHSGVTEKDMLALMSILKHSVDEVNAAGGLEQRLWDLGVATISVIEAQVKVVEGELPEGTEHEPLPKLASHEIDDLIASAFQGRQRDQRLLVRIVEDAASMRGYFQETLTGRGCTPQEAAACLPITDLAHFAAMGDSASRATMYRSLAAAIMGLDSETRRILLTEKILPDARGDDAIASIVRQMDIDEVCRMLVDGLADDAASRDGLSRAIRNLALISMAERDDVLNAAGAAMRGAGFTDEAVGQVLETALPTRIQISGGAPARESDEQIDAIFKLMDLSAGGMVKTVEDDPAVIALREEARRGITDGDVLGALVALVTLDPREEQFQNTMSMIEDSLELLLGRGDFEVAADAAMALKSSAENPETPEAQRMRMRSALAHFARRNELKMVLDALRVYKPDAAEYKAARQLLEILGHLAILPLLEILADEPDMTNRKALVDLMSNMASEYVEVLGEHVSDSRWFFVRNVVTILGSTKRPGIVTYLNRTLRHGDERVRRETIRALSGIGDRLAVEMLVAALEDDDASNVQLAARYLGISGVRGAVRPLEAVAKGEGRGNRETGPRVEAIEALGRLGAKESLPVLESLAGRRSIIGGARARELRAAAEAALARIAKGGAR